MESSSDRFSMDSGSVNSLKAVLVKFNVLCKECVSQRSTDQRTQSQRFSRFGEIRHTMRKICHSAGPMALLEHVDNLREVLDDPLAIALYMQLFYQRYFDVCAMNEQTANIEVYVQCLTNMSDIFEFFKDPSSTIDLPASWLWGIMDEFATAFEGMMWDMRQGGSESFPDYEEFASPYFLLNPLYEFLRVCNQFDLSSYKSHLLYRVLKYYSFVCLCRFHVCDADFASALKLMDQFGVEDKDKLTYSGGQWHCVFTADYYRAFCCLMSRRYLDAIRICNNSLNNILQTRETATRYGTTSTALSVPIAQIRSRLCHILALTLSFFPYEIDDKVTDEMRSVVSKEILDGLSNAERSAFSQAFLLAAPKFYSFDSAQTAQQSLEEQAQVFMMEVDEQLLFIQIRKVLSIYVSIPIATLAEKINKSQETTRDLLMSLKHKISIVERTATPGLRSPSIMDIYINDNIVYVNHTKPKEKCASQIAEHLVSLKKLAFERSKSLGGAGFGDLF